MPCYLIYTKPTSLPIPLWITCSHLEYLAGRGEVKNGQLQGLLVLSGNRTHHGQRLGGCELFPIFSRLFYDYLKDVDTDAKPERVEGTCRTNVSMPKDRIGSLVKVLKVDIAARQIRCIMLQSQRRALRRDALGGARAGLTPSCTRPQAFASWELHRWLRYSTNRGKAVRH